MGNPYAVEIEGTDGAIHVAGELTFTEPGNQPGANAQSGAGSPAGVVTPDAIGQLYVDTTNGGLYQAVGATNADWAQVGGRFPAGGVGVQLAAGAAWQVFDSAAIIGFLVDDSADVGGGTRSLVRTNTNILDNGVNGDAVFGADLDAASLGQTISYVTMQVGVPAGPYQTPLVFDSTAVSGGLYAWDGAAYQKVAPLP